MCPALFMSSSPSYATHVPGSHFLICKSERSEHTLVSQASILPESHHNFALPAYHLNHNLLKICILKFFKLEHICFTMLC